MIISFLTTTIAANMWSILLLLASLHTLAHGDGIFPSPHISPRGGFVPQSTMFPWHFPRSGPRPTFPEHRSRLPAPRGYRQQTTLRPTRMRGLRNLYDSDPPAQPSSELLADYRIAISQIIIPEAEIRSSGKFISDCSGESNAL